jgi:hypothetical protein
LPILGARIIAFSETDGKMAIEIHLGMPGRSTPAKRKSFLPGLCLRAFVPSLKIRVPKRSRRGRTSGRVQDRGRQEPRIERSIFLGGA